MHTSNFDLWLLKKEYNITKEITHTDRTLMKIHMALQHENTVLFIYALYFVCCHLIIENNAVK